MVAGKPAASSDPDTKMQGWKARKIADEVAHMVGKYAKKVAIVGSVRRGEKKVKDIDLLVIPNMIETPIQYTMMVDADGGVKRINQTLRMLGGEEDVRVVSSGDKRVAFYYKEESIKIEIWMVFDPEQWGMAMVVRTGPEDVTKRVMSLALHHHWHVTQYILHLHSKEKVGKGGECKKHLICSMIASTRDESEAFNALGLDYLLPEARNLERFILLEKKALGLSKDAEWR